MKPALLLLCLALAGCFQEKLDFICDTPKGRPECDFASVENTCAKFGLSSKQLLFCDESLNDARCIDAGEIDCGGQKVVVTCCHAFMSQQ